jgi:hypothetical protein
MTQFGADRHGYCGARRLGLGILARRRSAIWEQQLPYCGAAQPSQWHGAPGSCRDRGGSGLVVVRGVAVGEHHLAT